MPWSSFPIVNVASVVFAPVNSELAVRFEGQDFQFSVVVPKFSARFSFWSFHFVLLVNETGPGADSRPHYNTAGPCCQALVRDAENNSRVNGIERDRSFSEGGERRKRIEI